MDDLQRVEPAAGPGPAGGEVEAAEAIPVLRPGPALIARLVEEEPDLSAGAPIAFHSDLSADERALLDQHLAEPIAISGGAAADVRVARPDLSGDGLGDAIVIIHSGPYCGSGNVCNFWVFENTGGGWRPLNRGETDAANELFLMPGSSGGYFDLGLAGQCGREGGCSFVLRWAGDAYVWPQEPNRA